MESPVFVSARYLLDFKSLFSCVSFYELPCKVQTAMVVNIYKNHQNIPIGRLESSVRIKKSFIIYHHIHIPQGLKKTGQQRHTTAIWVFPKIVVPPFHTPSADHF